MRLAGSVRQRRRTAGQRSTEHEVLGGGDGRVVEPVVSGAQRAVAANDQGVVAALDAAAEALQHLHMRIDLTHAQRAAFHVVLDASRAEAGKQWRHQHDRRPHFLRQAVQLLVEQRVAVMNAHDAAFEVSMDLTADLLEHGEDLSHIGDVGHTAQMNRLTREQRRAQDGKHRVLVGRRHEPAGERRPAVNDEAGGAVRCLHGLLQRLTG
jgi:hypothetical protein